MFKGLGNLGSMLKQAQEMGTKMQGLTEELKTRRATGSSGGGMVEVEANGAGEILKVRIDPTLFKQNDVEMIEDLIPAAVNQAITKTKQMHAEAMQSMTGGLNLPGLDEALASVTGNTLPEDTPPEKHIARRHIAKKRSLARAPTYGIRWKSGRTTRQAAGHWQKIGRAARLSHPASPQRRSPCPCRGDSHSQRKRQILQELLQFSRRGRVYDLSRQSSRPVVAVCCGTAARSDGASNSRAHSTACTMCCSDVSPRSKASAPNS